MQLILILKIMNMQFQDISWAKPRITKMYMKNRNRSTSATFRKLRNNSYLSFIGDYPILHIILQTISELEIYPSRFQVNYALNQSGELNTYSKQYKSKLLSQLFKTTHVQTKLAENSQGNTKIQKMTNVSS